MSKNKFTFIQKIGSDADIETYLPQLKINGTISMKMKELCQICVLTKDDIYNRQRILNYIRSLFQPFYPDCLLIAFGSTINGLGIKGCDMDLMFSPSSNYENLDASEINDDGDSPTISDARENPSIMAQVKKMSKEKQLDFLLRVLRRNRNQIKHAVYIPAKCPIVRFHVLHNYHLWCDLSFQHGLARYNTELLRFFSVFDIRVKPLMITLRFWARHLKIVNTGALTSYAFNLLVVFFLQSLEKPILPPVSDLMINAESQIVDGWEAGFVSDERHNFISRNTLSEEELLREFFKFYWNFDFARYVVCIRTGKAKPVADIRKDNDERMKQFIITDICVQDPFNLSHNVARSLKFSKHNLFKPYLFVADLILSKKLQSLECKDSFQLLFERNFYENKIYEYFFFSNVSGSFYVNPDFEVISDVTDNFEKIWSEQASQAIRDILEYVFFIDCEVIDKDFSIEHTDFCDDYSESEQKYGKLLLSIQCAVDNRIWKYRCTKVKKDVPLDSYIENFTSEVLKEHNAFSHFLLASSPGLQSPEPFIWFLCNIYLSKFSQIPYILINFVPLCESSEFRSLSKVLKFFIPNTVRKMLVNQKF